MLGLESRPVWAGLSLYVGSVPVLSATHIYTHAVLKLLNAILAHWFIAAVTNPTRRYVSRPRLPDGVDSALPASVCSSMSLTTVKGG